MGEEKVKEEAMQIIGMFQVVPRLVVFDLDYTLWPFYCECRSKREMPSLYPHAKGILHALKDKGIDVAVASRSPSPDIANTFLEKLNIKSMFVAKVSKMGVTGILVGNGVNLGALRQGLTKFSQNWNTSQKNKQKWISKFSQKPDSSEKIDQK
ncbi:magnesium-dependent phosphatase 1 [Citrus sinensis]|uniref:Magnesium-dependent phosphatase 1 n=1 Tax=Citrus sinensis TaxID=2711 RepID=A0ACB8ILV1_CITSI|nr:magnesium-dependent phosphatase 1 [Citrus sinensis]